MVKKWKDKKDMTSPDDWYRSKRYYFLIGYSCHTFYCFQHFFRCIKKPSHYLIRCCGIVLPDNYIDLSDFIWVDMSAMKWSGRNTVQTWIWTRGPKNFLIFVRCSTNWAFWHQQSYWSILHIPTFNYIIKFGEYPYSTLTRQNQLT